MIEFLERIFAPLTGALGWALEYIHALGAPWWLSIAILTIVVRTILFPLTGIQVRGVPLSGSQSVSTLYAPRSLEALQEAQQERAGIRKDSTIMTMTGTTTPMASRVTAVFDNRAQAEQAITALRQMGISDQQLSVVAQHGGQTTATGGGSASAAADNASDTGERVGKGALAGAGAGALFGLAALAIPGVGPFITAGWLAEALGVTGGAIASGALVGGTSGAIAGAFAKAGYDENEAKYYGSAVEQGGILVAVDTAGGTAAADQIRSVLAQYGGRFAGASAV